MSSTWGKRQRMVPLTNRQIKLIDRCLTNWIDYCQERKTELSGVMSEPKGSKMTELSGELIDSWDKQIAEAIEARKVLSERG